MLIVHNLAKTFPAKQNWFKGTSEKPFTAVNNISFTIKQGEVVGLLGPNGAGKTTTLHMLLGTLTPTSGTIDYFGLPLKDNRSKILQQIAFGSAYTELPNRLTIRENLEIFGRLYGLHNGTTHTGTSSLLQQRIDQYLELFGLVDKANQETGTLSAGQKTRVMLAKTFMVHPRMILLDEPTASLDPDIAHDIRALIIRLQKEQELTVLIASHNMDEVATICDRVIVLSQGTIIADSTPELLAESVASVQVHLVITEGSERLVQYLQQHNLTYTMTDRVVEIHIDEHKISQLLVALASLNVHYDSIIIKKPTLEDYFLKIARLGRTGRTMHKGAL